MKRNEQHTPDKELIAERRAFIHEHMPEMLPEIKKLHALGAITGWRDVTHAGKDDPPVQGIAISGPFLSGNYFAKRGK